MEILQFKYQIMSGDYSHAGDASSHVKRNLKRLSIQNTLIKRVVVSMYEAEVNMIAHAFGGDINVNIDEEKIVAVFKDTGPGIANLELAMQKGFTTATEEVRQMGFGAGMGLPNIKKNADSLDIKSLINYGTTLTMTFYLNAEKE